MICRSLDLQQTRLPTLQPCARSIHKTPTLSSPESAQTLLLEGAIKCANKFYLFHPTEHLRHIAHENALIWIQILRNYIQSRAQRARPYPSFHRGNHPHHHRSDRQPYSTRSTIPLRVSSGNNPCTRCLMLHPSSLFLNTIFGRIECEVQNCSSRRSRSCHS